MKLVTKFPENNWKMHGLNFTVYIVCVDSFIFPRLLQCSGKVSFYTWVTT